MEHPRPSLASLTRVTAQALGWSWLALAATLVLQLVYTAVMSRVLEPADFGLVAAALVVLRFVTYLSRFGLGSAVVQRPSLSERDVAVALVLSVGVGSLAGLAAVALSPALAAVVNEPDAARVVRWLALGLFVAAVATVPEAVLRRQMRFLALGVCQVSSFVVGYFGVGVPLALSGWGVWSLVAANITQAVLMLAGCAAAARIRVRGRFDLRRARQFLTFGGTVTVTGFLEFLASSSDTMAVGRWIGAAGLGQYTRATYLVGLPVELANTATTRVLLPMFSRVQHDRTRFARGVLLGAGLMSLLVMLPVMAGVAAAPALVRLVLGEGWGPAARVLPIVAAAYGLALITHLPAVAAESKGAVGRKLAVQVVVFAVLLALIGFVVANGPTLQRLAACWLAGETLRFALYWVVVIPVLGVSRWQLARRYMTAALLAAVFAAPVLTAVRMLDRRGLLALAASSAIGSILALMVLVSPAARMLRDDLRIIRSNLQSA